MFQKSLGCEYESNNVLHAPRFMWNMRNTEEFSYSLNFFESM